LCGLTVIACNLIGIAEQIDGYTLHTCLQSGLPTSDLMLTVQMKFFCWYPSFWFVPNTCQKSFSNNSALL